LKGISALLRRLATIAAAPQEAAKEPPQPAPKPARARMR
jgi:hypothetical protein